MRGLIRHSRGVRVLLTTLALIVLAMRIVTPSGFMPVRTDHGVVVTLCTGQGAVNVVVHRDFAPGKKHQGDAPPQQHCAFAASGQSSVPPLALADLPLPAWQLAFGSIAFALRTGVIARLAAPPPPSSGPPATF